MVASAAYPGPARATKTRAQIIKPIPVLRVISLLCVEVYTTFASAPNRHYPVCHIACRALPTCRRGLELMSLVVYRPPLCQTIFMKHLEVPR